jgi:hypothetical protein
MMSFTAESSTRFAREAPVAGRGQSCLCFLSALLRALAIGVA